MLGSAAALKAHRHKPKRGKRDKCKKRPRERSYKGTEVDRIVQRAKREALLAWVAAVELEGEPLSY